MQSLLKISGKCSWFGGPADSGVGPSEGVALVADRTHAMTPKWAGLFVSQGDWREGLGLARNLNPLALYCAMRWGQYGLSSAALRGELIVRVQSNTGAVVWCRPVDYGPGSQTGRVIDLSKGALNYLGAATDDVLLIEVCA